MKPVYVVTKYDHGIRFYPGGNSYSTIEYASTDKHAALEAAWMVMDKSDWVHFAEVIEWDGRMRTVILELPLYGKKNREIYFEKLSSMLGKSITEGEQS